MQAAPTEQVPSLPNCRRGRVTIWLNPDYSAPLDREAIRDLPEILPGLPGRTTRLAGTVTSHEWHPDWHNGPGLMVRTYAHGGLLGPLAGTLFHGAQRMVREFEISVYARRRAVPSAVPVALRVERAFGPLVRAHYVSQRLPDADNMLSFFAGLSPGLPSSPAQGKRLSAAIADAIAQMHDAGIVHADLNLKNLLVRNAFDEPEIFIIDFDKATLHGSVTLRQRMGNLMRLDRSVLKWAASRRAVSPMDRLRTLHCYLERYPQWAAQWRQIGRRYASRHLLHCLTREPD